MLLTALYVFCILIWGLSFLPQLGFKRAGMLSICRGLWLLPILLSLTPRSESIDLPRALVKTPIHVLLDDSQSMKEGDFAKAEKMLDKIGSICKENACELKETLLSKENDLTKKGYTPLRQVLESWFGRIGQDPWIVISDGGDSTPQVPWPKEWEGLGQDAQKKTNGIVLAVEDKTSERLWIEDLTSAPVSFEGKTSRVEVLLQRKRKILKSETIQLQVSEEDHILHSENVFFPEGQKSLLTPLVLPSLSRGQHEIEVRVLAPPGEKILWDKVAHLSIEVVSNTLGVMHLLGGPSWDGRFLRRYLKAEPKYDLISFFILRDPWDIQAVDERELSLIPFPVARLFNEEIGKFRTIVLQNFNLLQFLISQHQENLVRFVKEGGALFFFGGERALQSRDLLSSPLRDLLPFELKEDLSKFNAWESSEELMNKSGPWYDKNLSFKIVPAETSPEKLALADVYEEWSLHADQIKELNGLKGMHHMENVRFKAGHTPLLDALTPDGKRIPLAVASYPGKGRAIWFFTDQIWRFAMTAQTEISRSVYNQLMESSFSWLMRHDFRKALSASRFQVQSWGVNKPLEWSVDLDGPAVRYLEAGKKWQFRVCGQSIDLHKSLLKKLGLTRASVSGRLEARLIKSKTCALEIRGEHPAFGSLFESMTTKIPDLIKDENLGVSELKMQQIAEITGAQFFSLREWDKILAFIETWLGEKTGHHGVQVPARSRTVWNNYWIFDSWWYFLLLLFLPLELVIRRWHKLRS